MTETLSELNIESEVSRSLPNACLCSRACQGIDENREGMAYSELSEVGHRHSCTYLYTE